ncbi:hypothetical protein F9802_12850 [Bacillus aerolatus]|uniref:Uncharacterized protein n=1 Tax=Bacillus aerolatus TaxID=2653354 RepID=A0A6I1FTZ3_9BACI|nr:hypothetical protein [Bacillus aerolatus]KAB7705948.1 hypothetical protein F9802_12850 [Bacillus aerolatus]
MKIYSMSSVVFAIIGLLFIGLSFVLQNFVEFLLVVGLAFLVAGVVVSVKAISRGEKGNVKFIAIAAFFSISLVIILVVPFHIVRVFTWVKNWPIIEELLRRMG